ncbi:TetR/AcrR family transcriptional regulator [Albibacterium indicum]|uniref:TetR/AcrR family transcriptional regulator n=1 Tax=Albibacterium indicum TaxID=2292082 RepID=UPI000E4FDD5D|nr:TetR/AcrR family transcriptional regulator [Pedobacter indicus]
MAGKKESKGTDTSTEDKIKAAARIVFHKKGYAATRTRDIAEEAGINLALLNYYFRSKEKLFNIIMTETLTGFVQNMAVVLNEEKTTLKEKVEQIASGYIDTIIAEPEVPGFIVSEIRNNPNDLLKKLPIKELVNKSVFVTQYKEAIAQGKVSESKPLHFLMNLIGLVVFPFIAKPLLMGIGNMEDPQFNKLMQERKKLIPIWISGMVKV